MSLRDIKCYCIDGVKCAYCVDVTPTPQAESVPVVSGEADRKREVLMDQSLRERILKLLIEVCGAWSDVKDGGDINEAKCQYASAKEKYLRAAINELADLSRPAPQADGEGDREGLERIAQRLDFQAGKIEQGERGDNAKLRQMARSLRTLAAGEDNDPTLPFESALSSLIGIIAPDLDSGDALDDAKQAAKIASKYATDRIAKEKLTIRAHGLAQELQAVIAERDHLRALAASKAPAEVTDEMVERAAEALWAWNESHMRGVSWKTCLARDDYRNKARAALTAALRPTSTTRAGEGK